MSNAPEKGMYIPIEHIKGALQLIDESLSDKQIMQRWEYTTLGGHSFADATLLNWNTPPSFQSRLNELGKEGWELVGISVKGEMRPISGDFRFGSGSISGGGGEISSMLIFKRPLL